MKNKYEQLTELEELRRNGTITEEEFQREKFRILNSPDPQNYRNTHLTNSFNMDNNTYLLLMHLSQFGGFIIPGLGFVIPIVMWATSKTNPEIDRHGRNIFNFMISMFIYFIISFVLCFLLIGIPLLIALGIMQVVVTIIAAVKAGNGEYWKYPLSIPFFGL